MRRKLVIWSLLLIGGFVAGFILQYARLQHIEVELSAASKQLASCQSSEQLSQLRDTATRMYLEAAQKNYGLAGEYAKEFLIKRSELSTAPMIAQCATYFVIPWTPAIRSRAISRREMPPQYQKYARLSPTSRIRSVENC